MNEAYCQKCGECCRELHFVVGVIRSPHEDQVREFYEIRGIQVGEQLGALWAIVPHRCRYLTQRGTCSIYEDRPESCRKYDGRKHDLTDCKARKAASPAEADVE